MSHFSVKGSLRISSGAIHSGVPAEEGSCTGVGVNALDSPKSQILTLKCLFTRQFPLFRSRCTIFILCMHISPLNNHREADVTYWAESRFGRNIAQINKKLSPPSYKILGMIFSLLRSMQRTYKSKFQLGIVLQHSINKVFFPPDYVLFTLLLIEATWHLTDRTWV